MVTCGCVTDMCNGSTQPLAGYCRYDFLAREQEVAALEGITVDDLYDMFVQHIAPPQAPSEEAGGGNGTAAAAAVAGAGSQRRKLSIWVRPHGPMKGAAKDGDKKEGEEEGEEQQQGAGQEGDEEKGDGAAVGSREVEVRRLTCLREELALHPQMVADPPAALRLDRK